jgi:NAD(P)-dependent dehydrogenase (short-subunit alcohol dehydrogenase family)
MDLELKGKCALVTGGSRGIGRAIVLGLAKQGAAVAAVYNNESEAVRMLRDELESVGNGSYVVQCDVSDEAAVKRLAEGVRDRFGRVDILVNNAGVVSHTTLADMTPAEWRRVLDTNLTAMYLVTQSVLDLLPQGASVVNVASAVAVVGMVGRTHYTASKMGVIGFNRSLCKELGPRGIRANVINPGIIDTDQAAGLTAEGRARYENLAALRRLGTADDVAGVALFLASDLSRFVSGVTITVDGGI